MKKYNHSLDFTVLALASAADGDFSTAGKLLVKASKAHDVKDAVAILEASNAQAFERLTASKKTAKPTVKAAGRVKASTQVRAFDIGDEDEINELIEDEDVDGADEDDVEEVEASDDDEEDEDEEEGDFDTAFASMLKGMKGSAKR